MSQPTSPRPKYDAYQAMLGIPPAEQPPNHYRLLGLPTFEPDADRIARAVQERADRLQTFLDGPRGAEAHQLLAAVAVVQKVLANPAEKAKYDSQLKAAGAKPSDSARWSLPVEKEPGRTGLVKAKPLAPPAKPAAAQPAVAQPLPSAAVPVALPTNTNAGTKNNSLPWLIPASAGGAFLLLLAIVLIVRALTSSPEPIASNPVVAPSAAPTPSPPPSIEAKPPDISTSPAVKPIPPEDPQPPVSPVPSPIDPPAESAPTVDPVPTTPSPETSAAPSAEEQTEAAKLHEEVAAAKIALAEHPKFKKLYDQIAAQPATLSVKGPELAALLWDEANENPTITSHLPSLLAALEEVERLAAAGNNYKTALAALAARFKHHPSLPIEEFRAAKSALVLEAAKAAAEPRAKSSERTEAKEQLRALVNEAIDAADEKVLAPLLAANASLAKTSADRIQAVADLLPSAEAALNDERIAVAVLLTEHLDALLQQVTGSKAKQDAQEQFDLLRARVKIASNALAAEKTLVTTPDDGQSHSLIGLHLIVNRSDCRGALVHLAKGHVKTWADLAAESLTAEDGRSKAALAERWSALSANPKSPAKIIARELVQEALADAAFVGIPRAAAEELQGQLGQVAKPKATAIAKPSPPVVKTPEPPKRPPAVAAKPSGKSAALPMNRWVDLLPLIEFNEDVKRGYWYPAGNGVQTESTFAAQMRLPVDLSGVSYDFQLEFDVGADADNVNAILPVGDTSVGLFVDVLDGRSTYLCDVDGRPAWSNPKAVREDLLKPNRSHRYDVSVRLNGDQSQIDFSLDGANRFTHQGPIRGLSLFRDWKLGASDSLPGFGAHETPVIFKNCRVKIVEGTAEFTRDKAADPFPEVPRGLRSESLTKLKPTSGNALNDYLAMSSKTRDPLIDGKECRDYIFAHAPSRVTFDIPTGAKYFTAFAYGAKSASVKFIVRVDGREMFTCEQIAILPFAVELPAKSKILELECDPLGESNYDHSCWCYPAFRR